MAATMKYGGLNAKVMAMRGRLLNHDDYYKLAQNRTVSDAAFVLKSYPAYSDAFAALDMDDLHRETLEQKIVLSLANDFQRLYSFIGDFSSRKYLDAFYLRNEIKIIRFLLRSVYDKRDITYTQTELHYLLGDRMKIEFSRLVASKTVPEFIENLRETDFYDVLSRRENMQSLFELEAELDMYYYTHLRKLAKRNLSGTNIKAAALINGTEIDLRNIVWIYRLKRYFSMNSNTVFAYLVPSYYNITKDDLIKMAEASQQDLDDEIDRSYYGYAFTDKENIDMGFYTAMNKSVKRACLSYPLSLAPAMTYLYLKELEIRNITSLIEGIRYNLRLDEILEHIIETR